MGCLTPPGPSPCLLGLWGEEQNLERGVACLVELGLDRGMAHVARPGGRAEISGAWLLSGDLCKCSQGGGVASRRAWPVPCGLWGICGLGGGTWWQCTVMGEQLGLGVGHGLGE